MPDKILLPYGMPNQKNANLCILYDYAKTIRQDVG